MKLDTVWDFVCKYYPNYDHDTSITESDDLQKIVDDEAELGSYAHKLLVERYKGKVDGAKLDLDLLNCEIYEKAIQGYVESIQGYNYYLFGEDYCDSYEVEGIAGLLLDYGDELRIDYHVRKLPRNANQIEVLEALHGWNEYIVLTKEEYQLISNYDKEDEIYMANIYLINWLAVTVSNINYDKRNKVIQKSSFTAHEEEILRTIPDAIYLKADNEHDWTPGKYKIEEWNVDNKQVQLNQDDLDEEYMWFDLFDIELIK